MDEKIDWSTTDKMLYVVGIPLLTLLAVLLFVAVVQAGGQHHAAAATRQKVDLSPAALRAQAREQAIQEWRDTYRDCLKNMGVPMGGFRSRFSRVPSRDSLRIASGVCSTVMQYRGGPAPSAPRHAPRLNSL